MGRRALPRLAGRRVSPVGEWGALIAAAIALISLIALFWNADYRPGVVAVAIFYAIAVAYFALVGRHKLVLSPEEEFAMTGGLHGHPEREGYGTMEREQLQTGAPGASPSGAPPTPPPA